MISSKLLNACTQSPQLQAPRLSTPLKIRRASNLYQQALKGLRDKNIQNWDFSVLMVFLACNAIVMAENLPNFHRMNSWLAH